MLEQLISMETFIFIHSLWFLYFMHLQLIRIINHSKPKRLRVAWYTPDYFYWCGYVLVCLSLALMFYVPDERWYERLVKAFFFGIDVFFIGVTRWNDSKAEVDE